MDNKMKKYKAVWVHQVVFEAENDKQANKYFWEDMNDGHLHNEPVEHGYVGFISMDCLDERRNVGDSIMPDDVWHLKK